MRGRTLILFVIAHRCSPAAPRRRCARGWRSGRWSPRRRRPPPPQKSILVARAPIARGQILKPADLVARPWPEAAISADYVLAGSGPEKSLAGSVARDPFVAGEPIIATKLVRPGDHGFLAAVLRPGHARGLGPGRRDFRHLGLCLCRRPGRHPRSPSHCRRRAPTTTAISTRLPRRCCGTCA